MLKIPVADSTVVGSDPRPQPRPLFKRSTSARATATAMATANIGIPDMSNSPVIKLTTAAQSAVVSDPAVGDGSLRHLDCSARASQNLPPEKMAVTDGRPPLPPRGVALDAEQEEDDHEAVPVDDEDNDEAAIAAEREISNMRAQVTLSRGDETISEGGNSEPHLSPKEVAVDLGQTQEFERVFYQSGTELYKLLAGPTDRSTLMHFERLVTLSRNTGLVVPQDLLQYLNRHLPETPDWSAVRRHFEIVGFLYWPPWSYDRRGDTSRARRKPDQQPRDKTLKTSFPLDDTEDCATFINKDEVTAVLSAVKGQTIMQGVGRVTRYTLIGSSKTDALEAIRQRDKETQDRILVRPNDHVLVAFGGGKISVARVTGMFAKFPRSMILSESRAADDRFFHLRILANTNPPASVSPPSTTLPALVDVDGQGAGSFSMVVSGSQIVGLAHFCRPRGLPPNTPARSMALDVNRYPTDARPAIMAGLAQKLDHKVVRRCAHSSKFRTCVCVISNWILTVFATVNPIITSQRSTLSTSKVFCNSMVAPSSAT